ncbi:MAG: hypothetical protein Kow00109_03500 [Acidobacteriota bacterium]
MTSWLAETLAALSAHPVFQGILAALGTLILEDPTTITCGLLVADGRLGFWVAFLGLSIGIAAGDAALYWVGRTVGSTGRMRRWLRRRGGDRIRDLLERNLVVAILLSRFLPGMRLPAYVGAGLLQASWTRFIAVVVGASILWTLILLTLTMKFGQLVLPALGDLRWPFLGAVLVVLVLARHRLLRRWREQALLPEESAGGAPGGGDLSERFENSEELVAAAPVAAFETWPPALFYAPVALYAVWLALRYGGAGCLTAVNPGIYLSGWVGESKSRILELVPPEEAHRVATWTRVSPREWSGLALVELERRLSRVGLGFPVVAKPDVGQRGDGVVLCRDVTALSRYLQAFPDGPDVLLQEFVPGPHEAGILYYRLPGEDVGRIFSLTYKEFPIVRGDGVHTVRELIARDERAGRFLESYAANLGERLDTVPAEGEEVPLVFSGNHCRGAVFRDATGRVTPELEREVERLMKKLPGVYFARLDVRFSSWDEFLGQGSFRILEINGAAAEATHIWDARNALRDVYATLFRQFRILYEIGSRNLARGIRPEGFWQVVREFAAYRRTAREYPLH